MKDWEGKDLVGVEEIGELKDDKMKDSRELKGGDRMKRERS